MLLLSSHSRNTLAAHNSTRELISMINSEHLLGTNLPKIKEAVAMQRPLHNFIDSLSAEQLHVV
jgi:hypothetical protein